MASIFTLWNTVEEATLMKLSKKQTRRWRGGGCYEWVSERIKLLFKTAGPDCWTCLCQCVCENVCVFVRVCEQHIHAFFFYYYYY